MSKLCTFCNIVPAEDGYVRCRKCREYQNEHSKLKRTRYKSAGLRTDGKAIRTTKVAYANREALGLCIQCSKPNTNGCKQCDHCQQIKRQWFADRKRKVISHYGGFCSCCGENSNLDFMVIDHIHGGGNKHIKSIGGNFYGWLIKNNFPEGFRVLCHNCNFSASLHNGKCVHELMKKDIFGV